jgi:resuscitation-promoting factor RpfB
MSSLSIPLERLEKARLYWNTLGRFQGAVRIGLLAFAFWLLWFLTALSITIQVDGVTETIITHRRTLEPLLSDLGLELQEADRISHPLATPLRRHLMVTVERSEPSLVVADGRELWVYSWAKTPRELLLAGGIGLEEYDRVLVNGIPVALDGVLPQHENGQITPTYRRGYSWQHIWREPLQIQVYRAIPVTVNDGNIPFVIHTTAQSVGEALREAQITLYLGDKVQPSLGSPVSTGLRVFIQRSTPVSLQADGRLIKTRTQGKVVGDVLAETGIGLSGLDRVSPLLDAELYDNMEIAITRIHEEIKIAEEIVGFETIFRGDPELLIDTQRVAHPGAEGITRYRYRVRYENGQEVARVLEDSWVAQEPAERVLTYGQKIEPRTFTTPDGRQLTYWRKIRMRASSYSASTAGVSPTASYYGRTRTGDRVS